MSKPPFHGRLLRSSSYRLRTRTVTIGSCGCHFGALNNLKEVKRASPYWGAWHKEERDTQEKKKGEEKK